MDEITYDEIDKIMKNSTTKELEEIKIVSQYLDMFLDPEYHGIWNDSYKLLIFYKLGKIKAKTTV